MKTLCIPLLSAAILAGCATKESENISPDFDYNKDVSIALEAESIGNWSLARSFLEHALEKDNAYREKATFDSRPALSDEMREKALAALSRIYYTTDEIDALFDHLHRYWQVPGEGAVEWMSGDEEEANFRYHLSWYCRLLDDHERFSEAQACWARLGNETRAQASIRAFELKEVFGRRH